MRLSAPLVLAVTAGLVYPPTLRGQDSSGDPEASFLTPEPEDRRSWKSSPSDEGVTDLKMRHPGQITPESSRCSELCGPAPWSRIGIESLRKPNREESDRRELMRLENPSCEG